MTLSGLNNTCGQKYKTELSVQAFLGRIALMF
jgi:hypothetical protein